MDKSLVIACSESNFVAGTINLKNYNIFFKL